MRHSNKERDNVAESRPGSNTAFHVFEMYAISILVLSRFSKTGFMLGFVYVIATLHYV